MIRIPINMLGLINSILATILAVRANYLNQLPGTGEMFAGFLFRVCVKI